MKSRKPQPPVLFFVLLLLALPLIANAAFNQRFGFQFHVYTDGTFRPTIQHIVVTSVRPGSAAAAGGMMVGDRIVEANGVKILGAPVERTSLMIGNTGPGERLLLKVVRNNGVTFHVDLVAGSR